MADSSATLVTTKRKRNAAWKRGEKWSPPRRAAVFKGQRRILGICWQHKLAACTHPACCVLPGYQSSDDEPECADLNDRVTDDAGDTQEPARIPSTPEQAPPADSSAPAVPTTPSEIGVRAPLTPDGLVSPDLPAAPVPTPSLVATLLSTAPVVASAPTASSVPPTDRPSSSSTAKDPRCWQWYRGRWHYHHMDW